MNCVLNIKAIITILRHPMKYYMCIKYSDNCRAIQNYKYGGHDLHIQTIPEAYKYGRSA